MKKLFELLIMGALVEMYHQGYKFQPETYVPMMHKRKPTMGELQRELDEALRNEEYEKAAQVRDALNRYRNGKAQV